MDGISWLKMIKYAAVLIAGIIIGNWFLAEAKKAYRLEQVWYKPYFTIPGLIILIALGLILIYWLFL